MSRLTVSVVIPAFNEEQSLATCLESLAAQTRLPDEIVVVDNNSTDATVEIAKQFERYGVRVVHERRQGIGYTRTRGFDTAKYDVIIRIDADCIALRDYVERIMNDFECHEDTDAVAAGLLVKEWLPTWPWLAEYVPYAMHTYHRLVFGGYILYGNTMAIRREFWIRIRDTVVARDDLINEDIQLSIICHREGIVRRDKMAKVICEIKDGFRFKKALRYFIADMKTALHRNEV